MLIIFAGLPGTGKSTIAKLLAKRLSAVYIRIDSIEQAIKSSLNISEVGPSGYNVGYNLALDNIRLGLTVVADSVNPLEITRQAWREVAMQAKVNFLEVEIICSDQNEHQNRVMSRTADIPLHKLPTWQEVLARNYEPWNTEHLIIDTAKCSAQTAIELIIKTIIKK